MYLVNSYFTVAIVLAAIAGIMIAILRWHESVAANRRMLRMMVSCGIDEQTATHADQRLNLDMSIVRSRCRNCRDTDLCERWLDGEASLSNSFCPNARYFTAAAGPGRS